MELATISEISRGLNISTRTLRYYEQIGLISSTRKDDYAYRVYDEDAISRLRQIVVLRKLRVPLKQIAQILQIGTTEPLIETLQQSLSEVDDEIDALGTIREILASFIERLSESAHTDITLSLLDDSAVLEAVDALTVTRQQLDKPGAAELEQASVTLGKLTDRDVRIIYLPPSSVASIHIVGEQPETDTGDVLFEFIKNSGLPKRYPEFRHYGFNHDRDDKHGYERWVTIPNDMDVPAPFVKRQFPGGLYAAFMTPMGMFDEWNRLYEWAENHSSYEIVWGNPECMHGMVEEHLNAFNHYLWSHERRDRDLQLDLLIPIREKQ
jgi:DNA-binding transcriptional MerR regulator/DNA gyrase inhibitor GyrI